MLRQNRTKTLSPDLMLSQPRHSACEDWAVVTIPLG
jgi:hypothetical protein